MESNNRDALVGHKNSLAQYYHCCIMIFVWRKNYPSVVSSFYFESWPIFLLSNPTASYSFFVHSSKELLEYTCTSVRTPVTCTYNVVQDSMQDFFLLSLSACSFMCHAH